MLDQLLEKCSTDAQRVTMLREALDIAEKEASAVAAVVHIVDCPDHPGRFRGCTDLDGSTDPAAVARWLVSHANGGSICLICVAEVIANRAGWQRDCLAAVAREHRLERMIATARRIMRGGPGWKHGLVVGQKAFADAYRALDTRARR